MDVSSSHRPAGAWLASVAPFVALVAIAAFAYITGQEDVYIAMLAVVPMLAATLTTLTMTAIVAVLTLGTALGLAYLPARDDISTAVPSLIGVAVFGVLAVLACHFRPSTSGRSTARSDQRPGPQPAMQASADTDAMTGLLNRRGAIRAMGPRNESSERVVAFMDCDLFKNVNDHYGTDVGDEFLQAIAGRLRHALPAHDTVARWDGDEFLVVVSADAANAQPALQRVMKSISSHPIRTTAGPIPASVSVGAAVWLPGQSLEDVIAGAGASLQAAKSGGRGAIVLEPPASDDS